MDSILGKPLTNDRTAMKNEMCAFTGAALGSLDDYRQATVSVPVPRTGQVRVRVEATALGFVDGLIVQGRYQIKPPLPYIPGGEIAGVVEAVGPGVETVQVGDRVVTWQLGGGLAEKVVLDARDIDVLPSGLPSQTAAAMLVDFQTSHYAVCELARVAAGETVLVFGASGGVGSAAVQMAANAGAFVVAAASTEDKRKAALELGARATVDYTRQDWREELKRVAPGGVVDVVVDPIGGSSFEPAFRSLAKDGRYLVIGFASGTIPSLPVNLALLKSASLVGVEIRHLLARDPSKARRIRRALFSMVENGRLKPPRTVRYTLADSREALRMTMSRQRMGKVVVVQDSEMTTLPDSAAQGDEH
jgi:NADPH2:quinone reductase